VDTGPEFTILAAADPGEWPRVNRRAKPRSHATARPGRHQRGDSEQDTASTRKDRSAATRPHTCRVSRLNLRAARVWPGARQASLPTQRGKPAEACLPRRTREPISPFCASELIVARTADLAPFGGSARVLRQAFRRWRWWDAGDGQRSPDSIWR